MVEFSVLDLAAREVGNGIWAGLALLLAAYFGRFAWRNWGRGDYLAQGAAALGVYFTGAALRAFLGWGATAAARRPTWSPDPWSTSWPWYLPSVALSITGVAWALWVFTPTRQRPLVFALFLVAVFAPLVFFLMHH